MHLPVNSLLQGGKYKIVRFISSGGFGCTYEAEHVMLEKRVAIKEFFVKDFCNREETTAHVTVGTVSKKGLVEKLRHKFIDEAKALCKLQHPGIVSVSDVFEENGTAYFVMDYIEGRSLSDLVNTEGPLPEARALEYIRQVADALQYVHDNNRLHLDVKPGNIMVSHDGRTVLIDFGASKQYDEMDGENTSTLMGKTPGYAPPEQMSNSVVRFLPATDVYALGATLYKMLTGITPIDANLRISGEELEPIPTVISASTREAVAAAMTINKNNRPQSITAFVGQLFPAIEVTPDPDAGEETIIEVEKSGNKQPQPAPQPQPEPEPQPEPQPEPRPISVPADKSRNWFVSLCIWGSMLFSLALFALFLYVVYRQDDQIWLFRGIAICCVFSSLGCWLMWKHIRWGFWLFVVMLGCILLLMRAPYYVTLLGVGLVGAIAFGVLQIRKNGISAWKHMDYRIIKPGILPACGAAALAILGAIVSPNRYAVEARNHLDDYRNMVKECREKIEQGSQFDPQPLIDAKQLLKVISEDDSYYGWYNASYGESYGLQNALTHKAKSAAESWATAGDSQARIGNSDKALECYTTAIQLDGESTSIRNKFEERAKPLAFMKPLELEFSGEGEWGETLRADEIKYLYTRLKYDALDLTKSHEVTLIVKIYENGVLQYNSQQYSSNYTYTHDVTVQPLEGGYIELAGWGNEDGNAYNPGTIRVEIWCGNKKLISQTTTMN